MPFAQTLQPSPAAQSAVALQIAPHFAVHTPALHVVHDPQRQSAFVVQVSPQLHSWHWFAMQTLQPGAPQSLPNEHGAPHPEVHFPIQHCVHGDVWSQSRLSLHAEKHGVPFSQMPPKPPLHFEHDAEGQSLLPYGHD